MTLGELLLLGAIAGYTIFLGLPIARVRGINALWSIAASGASAGILLFLVIDITSHLLEPIEEAAKNLAGAGAGAGYLLVLSVVALIGLAASFLGLVYLPRFINGRRNHLARAADSLQATHNSPLEVAVLIVVGIGLHNFAEGLAIGQAAATGSMQLALVLVIGFALHNATEGFGITGPLIGRIRPSRRFLTLVGLIGGSPTFVGTLVGRVYTSDVVSTLFLALAAGSIVYVIQTLIFEGLQKGKPEAFSIGLLVGLTLGIATDLIIAAAGA